MRVSRRWRVTALVFLLLLAADMGSKHWIADRLKGGRLKTVIPGFLNLTMVHNKGAAFGIGNEWGTFFFIAVTLIAVGVIGYLFVKLRPEEKLSHWALTLILAGAIGNLIDRIRLGYVIDFVDVYFRHWHYWTFNVADSAITIGALLFAWGLHKSRKPKAAA